MLKLYQVPVIFLLFIFASCHLAKRAEYRSSIENDLAFYEKQAATVKRLNNKKDSLDNAKNIFDTVVSNVTIDLRKEQAKIDSIKEELIFLKRWLNFRTGYLEEYKYVKARTKEIHDRVVANGASYDDLFMQINKRLDDGNLGGEKGKLYGMLNNADAQQKKEAAKVSEIGNTKDSLLSSGNVDDSTSSSIDVRLKKYQRRMDSITAEIEQLRSQLNSPGEFRKDFTIIKAKIILVDSVVNKGAATRENMYAMILESLLKAKPNLFSLAAFFGPGGYQIPADKYDMASTYFSPIIDSLLNFSNNYKILNRIVTVIVIGFADASRISPGSKLYKILTQQMGKQAASSEELNRELSYMRAVEISELLQRIMKERYSEFKAIDKIIFEAVEAGQGEKFPNPRITDYRVNDERRRVVVIYWNVLPNN